MDALKEANRRALEFVASRPGHLPDPEVELTTDELIDKLAGMKTRINELEQALFTAQQDYEAVKVQLREATKRDILQGETNGDD